MNSFRDSLAAWATILGTIISLIGLIQSRTWITVIGAFFVALSIVAVIYGRKEHQLINSATLRVDTRSLDSLNVANLTRRHNRSLVIQKADHLARIEGEDLQIDWRYAGYCRADREVAIDFSIDADNNVPFDQLECFAYDLGHDPDKTHKIRPMLIGADGISKKVAVPFLEPLVREQEFDVVLRCELPGCMKAGVEYYTSTVSFDQQPSPRPVVRLVFIGRLPAWVRVYESDSSGRTHLIKDLQPLREMEGFAEYSDAADYVEVQSTRVYMFHRA